MAKEYLIQGDTLTNIADKIRVLSGSEDDMGLDDMATHISDVNVSIDAVLSAIANRGVQVPEGANINSIAGLIGDIEAELPELTTPATSEELFANKELIDSNGNVVTGTFTIDSELSTQDSLIDQIQNVVNELPDVSDLEPVLQEKTVTPSTSSQNVVADSGYDGLSKVTVNAMPTATQATPSISINSSGLITASATQTAGYVASGTKSATKQLTTQAAKTITPSTSSQTAVASGRYTTGAVTVAAIPSSYIQPSGTKTITTNGTHDVKSYASATVNVSSGSSSGGSSVETCTVTFENNSDDGCDIYGVWYEDSSIISYATYVSDGDSTTKTAVKNSFVIIPTTSVSASVGNPDNYTVSGASIVKITSNTTITIT